MTIIITGSSGFLGRAISSYFKKEHLISIGRTNSIISCDLSTHIPPMPAVDLVIHSAGKAHSIPKTDVEKQVFFDVNVKGTQNLLTGLEQSTSLPQSFIFISSVAVYGVESGTNIDEEHPLKAKDPYGLSKIQAEKIVQEWCAKNNIICSILRLPLLVGSNPPGNLGAMINGIRTGYYFNIAGGTAKKSMVLASDVAKLIPHVAKIGGIYNLSDGYHPSFGELADLMAKQLNKNSVKNIPLWLANLIGKIGNLAGSKSPINEKIVIKITSDLTFDDSKAKRVLNWKPKFVLEEFKIK